MRIDWAGAQAGDGRLTVGLGGEPSAAWAKRAAAVAERLAGTGRDWGEVKVTRKQIVVDSPVEGREDELRHFLEGVVQQANADLAPDDDGTGDGQGDNPMTATFRSFADEPDDD